MEACVPRPCAQCSSPKVCREWTEVALGFFVFCFMVAVHVLLVINNIKQQVNKTLFCSLGNRFG